MNSTLELLKDLAILEKVIAAASTAASARPGDKIADIKGVRIAGKKLTITLTAE